MAGGGVCQEQLPSYIPDRPNARNVGSHAVVNLHKTALVNRYTHVFQPDIA